MSRGDMRRMELMIALNRRGGLVELEMKQTWGKKRSSKFPIGAWAVTGCVCVVFLTQRGCIS